MKRYFMKYITRLATRLMSVPFREEIVNKYNIHLNH